MIPLRVNRECGCLKLVKWKRMRESKRARDNKETRGRAFGPGTIEKK